MPFVAPEAVSLKFRSPLVIGTGALPPQLRQPVNILPAAKQTAVVSDSPISAESLFSVGASALQRVLGGYDAVKEAWQDLRSGLYARGLRKEFEGARASDHLQRYVFDAQGWMRLPPAARLVRKEGDPASGNKEADLAYEHGGFVFDFFKQHLNVVLPQPLLQVVNFKEDARDTGWFNAMQVPYFLGANFMLYGQGDGRTYRSMVHAIDVVGHEITHEYLQEIYPEKFPYQDQPGAINEHICDVVGVCVKAKRLDVKSGYPEGFWRCGSELMMNPAFCVNDMLNPGTAFSNFEAGDDPQVGDMEDFVLGADDNGGVHANAGILNRTFALFCESVKGPCFGAPLDIWMRAVRDCPDEPSFRQFAEALLSAAEEYDDANNTKLKGKLRAACRKTGILNHAVVDGEVVRLGRASRE